MDEQTFRSVIVVAPHLDDETLGVGGSVKKLIDNGATVTILLVTQLKHSGINQTIQNLKNEFVSANFIHLNHEPSTLTMDVLPCLVNEIKTVIHQSECTALFIPFWDDAHSDHNVVSHASMAAAKSFRSTTIKLIAAYEVPSETDFAYRSLFAPNLFIDISAHIKEKRKALALHEEEVVSGPLPRQIDNVLSLSRYRGGRIGTEYAEAFQIIMWKS